MRGVLAKEVKAVIAALGGGAPTAAGIMPDKVININDG